MKRLILTAAIVLLVPTAISAQENPKGELFGGFSHVRVMGEHINGWNASIAGIPSRSFGFVADFAGYYRGGGALHSFMFGPRFTYRKHERVTPFAQVLVGAALATNGGSDSIFSMALGGGLDLKVGPRLAVRLPQVDFLMARDDGINTGAFRLGLGVVYRF